MVFQRLRDLREDKDLTQENFWEYSKEVIPGMKEDSK